MDEPVDHQLAADRSPGGCLRALHLYKEDVVCLTSDQKKSVGIIAKTSLAESDSESEEMEEEEEDEELEDGQARVSWLHTATRTTEEMGELRVVDRAFLHGDIVANAADPLGQTGTVIDLEILVDLRTPTGETLMGIDSKRLRRVRSFRPEQCVIHGRWLGRVQEVADDVTVLFDDGAKCQIQRAEPERLYSLHMNPLHDDEETPFYPGQRLRAGTSALYKNAKWLRGQWKPHRLEGTVVDVEVGTVMVHWLAAGCPSKPGESQSQPPMCMDPKDLHPVNYWEFANWRLGDLSLTPSGVCNEEGSAGSVDFGLNAEEAETSTSGDVSETFSTPGFMRAKRKALKKEKKRMAKMGLEEEYEKTLLVVGIQTKLDVLWQDGTVSKSLEGPSLIRVDYLGGNDFFPHEYVMEKPPDGDTYTPFAEQKTGWVKSVDAKQRTAVVCWLNNSAEDKLDADLESVESVYELVEHADYSYRLGDVVIRFSTSLPNSGGWESKEGAHDESDKERQVAEDAHAGDSSKMQAEKNQEAGAGNEGGLQLLSWVGEIIELQDGFISVCWADGTKSRVSPQEVFVVTRMDDQTEGEGDDGDSQYVEDHSEDGEDVGRESGEEDGDGHGSDSQAIWETDEENDDAVSQPGNDMAVVGELSSSSPVAVSTGEGADSASLEKASAQEAVELAWDGSSNEAGGTLGMASMMFLKLAGLFGGPQAPSDNARAADAENWGGHARQGSLGLADILRDDVHGIGGPTQHSGESSQLSCACPVASSAAHSVDTPHCSSQATGAVEAVVVSPTTSTTDVTMADATSAGESGAVENEPIAMDEEEDRASAEPLDTGEHGGEAQVPNGSSEGAQEEPTEFKRFNCLQSPSDHFYKGESGQVFGKKWMKKVQQEWAMLEKNLPDTIAVRVYEDRMDLLRAVIIGASGTPYDDGLFFFDFYFPPDYPNSPPMAHYHSGGLRVNPNLYNNGKVCLSLLNTWNGKGNEVWTPTTSTLLQVLVSLQGLVLVPKPYFNEAGYEKQMGSAEGEKNAVVYNENTFLLCCKSILYLLRRPPQHFEDFVKNHFRERAAKILWACDAYLSGATVGSLPDKIPEGGGVPAAASPSDGTSTGFKLMLTKLRVRLAEAFALL